MRSNVITSRLTQLMYMAPGRRNWK